MCKHPAKNNTIKIVLDGHEIDDVVDYRLEQDKEKDVQLLHLTIAVEQCSAVTNVLNGAAISSLWAKGFNGAITEPTCNECAMQAEC